MLSLANQLEVDYNSALCSPSPVQTPTDTSLSTLVPDFAEICGWNDETMAAVMSALQQSAMLERPQLATASSQDQLYTSVTAQEEQVAPGASPLCVPLSCINPFYVPSPTYPYLSDAHLAFPGPTEAITSAPDVQIAQDVVQGFLVPASSSYYSAYAYGEYCSPHLSFASLSPASTTPPLTPSETSSSFYTDSAVGSPCFASNSPCAPLPATSFCPDSPEAASCSPSPARESSPTSGQVPVPSATTPGARGSGKASLKAGKAVQASNARKPSDRRNAKADVLLPSVPAPAPAREVRRRNKVVSHSAEDEARARAETPPDASKWRCPYCTYTQKSKRKPDFDRHVRTHISGAPGYVCCGLPLAAARKAGVPAALCDAAEAERGADAFVGGCGETFGRKDTYRRHLRNVRQKGRCFGNPEGHWHLGEFKFTN